MKGKQHRLQDLLDAWLADPTPPAALALLEEAEKILAAGAVGLVAPELWHLYLNETRRTVFLRALPDAPARERWAETTFPVIRATDFGLEALLRQRVAEHPHRTLFEEMEAGDLRSWSYEAIYRRIRTIAAVFWSAVEEPPRVAIVSENQLDMACCDLACLAHDILVTPLNPHFSPDVLAWIFDRLQINLVVAGTEEIRDRLESVRPLAHRPFHVFLLDPDAGVSRPEESVLAEALARLGPQETGWILEERPRRKVTDLATVMFTSGTTGMPKGVQFSEYCLVTKRFARAAALPNVGDDEILFSFLPLYHTFGRYLELQGMIFWGGTYVFAENPSLDTLLWGLREVRPTGLISIPRRWQQIREACLAEMDRVQGAEARERAFRQVVGDRLRWGLSAAGALEPAVFHFFHRHGVDLCSGFGMTEATGGILMTPPGAYEDNTVGVPLPGIRVRLSDEGELQVSGHYVGRYLDEPPPSPDDEYWLATGDIFRRRESGYYEIVDRIKDIYKNSKGQTIAPGAIEQKLAHVPGITRCFVVGDGREYNVLLIVPDLSDPVLAEGPQSEKTVDYFRQVIAAANLELAPYERVVNFAILPRDFDRERGELTPKGSYNRKVIQENFRDIIETLYQREFVELEAGEIKVRIPRWFFRDLGILETDITAFPEGLLNRRTRRFLGLARRLEEGGVQVGDLEYFVEGKVLDLGLFARQPMLWVANPSLIAFAPCREGWDLPLRNVSYQVALPRRGEQERLLTAVVTPTGIRDSALLEVNRLCTTALFAPSPEALRAIEELEGMLGRVDRRLARLIHRRLEALARHPDIRVRSLAYRIFLLKGPAPDFRRERPSFLLSGLPFLTEESIQAIVDSNIERSRLEALRLRMQHYRTQLPWPGSPATRAQIEGIFALLVTFVTRRPEFYAQVRAELASWILHRQDPQMAEIARRYLDRMVEWFEGHLEAMTRNNEPWRWEGKIVFQDRITEGEVERLRAALVGTTFLKQSIMLAFDDRGVEVEEIAPNGVWVAQVFSLLRSRVYRVSVNTLAGKHYDLLVGIAAPGQEEETLEMTLWMVALGGKPDSPPVVRHFGCYRPDLRAFSMASVNDLTVWERVRELTGESFVEFHPERRHWRNLFIRGMQAFFTVWAQSDGRIVPGPVSPMNVAVPARDYRQTATLLALADLGPYEGPLSLVRPLLKNFYLPTVSYYPWTREILDITWVFDAVMEALGRAGGADFLKELALALETSAIPEVDASWRLKERLEEYREKLQAEYRIPLALHCAVERYRAWERDNPRATPQAREKHILEMYRLYRLEEHGDLGRYTFYRHTYFAGFPDETCRAFDRLLRKMFHAPDLRPTHLVELSELQDTLASEADRLVFSRMVFPAARLRRPVEVQAVGQEGRGVVVVSAQVRDRRGDLYTIREPVGPAEIGRLYRLYLEAGMPFSLGDQARYLLAVDSEQRIVGGICYEITEPGVAHMDGLVISAALRGQGLGGELLEEFALRMRAQGIRVINTHFISRPFLRAHGFQLDEAWGGLVRFLEEEGLEGRPAPEGAGRPEAAVSTHG